VIRAGAHRDQRAPRVILVAAAISVLSLAGHTAGGGAVDLLGIGAVIALATGLAATTTRRSLSWVRVWVVLLAAQALLHVVLTFTSGHAHSATAVSVPAMVLGHVIASVMAAAIVVHADALLRRWAAYLAAAIGAALPEPREPGVAVSGLHVRGPEGNPVVTATRHRIVRRGPPPLSAVAFLP